MTARWCLSLGILGAAVLHPMVAQPSIAAEAREGRTFDCVVEPAMTIKLGAPVSGLLSVVSVDRGDLVKAGQIVAQLESGVEAANVALAQNRASNDAQLQSNQSRQDFLARKAARHKELKQNNAIAESNVDESETDAKIAAFATHEADLNLQANRLELSRQQQILKQRMIVSPIDGIVTERKLNAGEYVNDTSSILTIAKIDPLFVEVFVPTSDFGRIRAGTMAKVFPEVPAGSSYSANVSVVDEVLDSGSGTFGVRLRAPNPDHKLAAGLRCRVVFEDSLTALTGDEQHR